MAAGSFFEIALIVAIGGGLFALGLVWLADYRSWQRYLDRLNDQLALAEAERSYGDVVELHPEAIARGGKSIAGGEGGIKAAPAQVRTRHIAHDSGVNSR